MRMEKRKFRIGELAEHLAVERFVIRFWEKEFDLKPARSVGGQRFYDEDDARIFGAIKELLYNRGFTIAGARKELPRIKQGAHLIKKADFKEAAYEPNTEKKELTLRAFLKQLKQELSAIRSLITTIR